MSELRLSARNVPHALPPGWAWVNIGELQPEFQNGASSRGEAGGTPTIVLRLADVINGQISLAKPRRVLLSDQTREKYRAAQDDILVIRVNGSKEITGQFILCNVDDLVFCDHFIRMRIADDLAHPRYLAALSNSSLIRRQIEQSLVSTAGQNTINQSRLRSILIPLPPRIEQERIVAAIEQHLSRIDAGVAALQSARTRVLSLVKAVLLAAVPDEPPLGWTTVTVGEAGEVRLGRQRSPRFHRGPHMRPYLRVANVFEDRIDTSDVMTMHFSDEEFAQYRLEPGDILLNEGQSPHLLGRPAMYRGDPPNVAFTNSLLRFRANTGVLPEWALLVFRRHLHAKRFMRESQITTNIAHLSAGRFKNIEFPIPSVDEQRRILISVDEKLSLLAAMLITLDQQRVRASTIRSAILAAAFSGRLVPQDPSDEPASVLMGRIASERAASNAHRPSIKPGITKVTA